jgi:hypothetical protein
VRLLLAAQGFLEPRAVVGLDRYYVCFDEGKVASFGKVDAAPSG